MIIKTRAEIIKTYLFTFLELDISLIEGLLEEGFYYTSSYFPKVKLNKQEYLNFLETKFDLIKSLGYKILARSDSSIDLYIETDEVKTRIGILRLITDKGKIKKALVFKSYITEKDLLKILPI